MIVSVFTVNLPSVHAATTRTVTTTADDASGGTCVTTCTLRDALHSAANGDTIQFKSGVTGTITLGSAGTLTIATNVMVTGPGASNLAIDGNNLVTVFTVSSGITASISGLTIQHGKGDDAGGINNAGTLTVSSIIFSSDQAVVAGGGIGNAGILTVNNSTFLGNSSLVGDGGGIDNNGTLIVNNTCFSDNSVGNNGYGGGIHNRYLAVLTVTNSTFSGNTSGNAGGGILNDSGGIVTIGNSTFSGNSAPSSLSERNN